MKPLLLVVGRSGSGKNYVCDVFNLNTIPSYTTRPIRKTEQEGREHRFVTIEDWDKATHGNKVAAFTLFAGNHYWSTKDQVEDSIYEAYIIDPRGVDTLLFEKEKGDIKRDVKVVVIFSGLMTRIRNMRRRKDSWFSIIKRIFNDRKEFKAIEKEARKKKYISLYL